MAIQPAVTGQMRLGNFRLGYTGTPAAMAAAATRVSIVLAGVDARPRVRLGSLTIHDALNDAPNTCTLAVDDTTPPTVAQSLRITVNSDDPVLLFNGTLQAVDLSYEGLPAQGVYRCSATDDLAQLNRRLPFGTWINTSATTVALALLADFAPEFTGTHVQAGLPLISVTFDGTEGFSGALSQIAKLIGGYFYVEDLDLHLFQTEAADTPDDLDVTPKRFLDDPPITVTTDLSQLRTRVYGKGFGAPTLAEATIGQTTVAVDHASPWFSASGGQAIVLGQILSYTGLGVGYVPTVNAWQSQTPAAVSDWTSVAWSPALGLLVAVGGNASTFGVMTSPDGITWTTRTASLSTWASVTWAPALNLFVAVAVAGTDRVMTSPDGLTWTNRTVPEPANAWQCVVWAPGLSLLVAVASTGTNRVMTSPNGITWTARPASSALDWRTVVWAPSLNLLVAGASSGANSIMTSPTGTTWTGRTIASGSGAGALAWSPAVGRFVALGTAGAAFTSPDGVTWTAVTLVSASNWSAVIWVPGLDLFVAVSTNAPTYRIMTSPDGIVWTGHLAPALGTWVALAWAPSLGRVVAVGLLSGSPTIQIMTNTSPMFDTLVGIPASGPGSIAVPILAGTSVHLWVQRDDLPAQAAVAALEGGTSDGIYEHLISDERRGEASLIALCDADLALFSSPLITVQYATRDLKTKSGKTITVNLTEPPISAELTIQDVQITEIDIAPGLAPRFTVTASNVRFSLEDLLRRMMTASLGGA